jgi:hypothetical protein
MPNTANNTNDKTQVSNKVRQWIEDEGFQLLPEEDPYNDFTFKIRYSENETAYVLMRKDRKDSITVYARSDFSPLDRKAFSNLPPGKKREFINAISASLFNLNLHFEFQPNVEQMKYLHIKKDIFFDGLTKDRFFDTICKVLSGMQLANMAYYQHLNPNGSNSSLRCLFL